MKGRLIGFILYMIVFILGGLFGYFVLPPIVKAMKSESYCLCPDKYGRRQSVCQPAGYNQEHGYSVYMDFAANQKKYGGPKWNTKDFGQYDYPENKQCC